MKIDKTKSALNWMCSNLVVIVAMTIYSAYAIILYLPSHYSWFELQRNIIAAGEIIVGIIEFPLRLFSLATFSAPWQFMAMLAFFYFCVAGFAVGKITQALYRKGWIGRIAILSAFIFNGVIGFFMMAWGDILVIEKPAQSCENFITEQDGLRIVVFEEAGVLSGNHFFYLFTSNGGNDWKQLMTVRNDDPVEPDCNTIGSLGENFIWVWSSFSVRTTNDGGVSWNAWDWQCCTYGGVQDVIFQDQRNGIMTVFPWRSTISELLTRDGGKTWEPRVDP
jgi:hypothetical protein